MLYSAVEVLQINNREQSDCIEAFLFLLGLDPLVSYFWNWCKVGDLRGYIVPWSWPFLPHVGFRGEQKL